MHLLAVWLNFFFFFLAVMIGFFLEEGVKTCLIAPMSPFITRQLFFLFFFVFAPLVYAKKMGTLCGVCSEKTKRDVHVDGIETIKCLNGV